VLVALTVGGESASRAAQQGPVTDAEVRQFATALERGVAAGDTSVFASEIDWNSIIDKSMAGVEAPQQFRDGFRKGAKGSLEKSNNMAAQIIDQARKGGSYRLLRSRLVDKHKTALFRLALPEGAGVNYHEFALERGADGNVRAADFFVFFSGETMSQTFRRGYVQAAAQQNRGLFSRLVGADQDYANSLPKLKEMGDLTRAGKNREALDVYDKLPAAVQKDKTFLLLRLQAAQQVDERTYSAAIERLRELYPKDPCVDILSIDGFALLKQYDKSIAAIDHLDKSLGGDPYLNILRAGVFLTANQPEKARDAAAAGVKGSPDMISCYWSLLTAYLRLADHAAALKTLKLIDQTFRLEFGDLTTVPEYAKFVKSPQYEEWKRYLKNKNKTAGEGAEKK
jgi:hypothetical protein